MANENIFIKYLNDKGVNAATLMSVPELAAKTILASEEEVKTIAHQVANELETKIPTNEEIAEIAQNEAGRVVSQKVYPVLIGNRTVDGNTITFDVLEGDIDEAFAAAQVGANVKVFQKFESTSLNIGSFFLISSEDNTICSKAANGGIIFRFFFKETTAIIGYNNKDNMPYMLQMLQWNSAVDRTKMTASTVSNYTFPPAVTTAENGKVLGVTNGAMAWQELSQSDVSALQEQVNSLDSQVAEIPNTYVTTSALEQNYMPIWYGTQAAFDELPADADPNKLYIIID